MEKNLVSVIIPLYNGERYLAEAIESVLAQTYDPTEIIAVDDGSPDNSADIAQSYAQVHLIRQSNQGLGAARNTGIKAARGDYLAFIDQDDLWVASKLALQMAAFSQDSEIDIVFGHVEQFYSPELNEEQKGKIVGAGEILPGRFPGTMLVKTVSFLRAGLFPTQWRFGEFLDWYARAMDCQLRSLMLPDVVAKRRLHTTNMGITMSESRIDYVRVLKAALDRRRQPESEEARQGPNR
jgi:glycosyltransferase involved in cell wall biosynthesis